MRAVDTNVLVRLIAHDDLRQVALAKSYIEQGAWVPLLALAEAIWVLAQIYRLNAADLIAGIENLLTQRKLVLQDADVVAEALELFRSKPSLGFSDCLILHSARKAGHLPLGTFDRSLAKVAGCQRL